MLVRVGNATARAKQAKNCCIFSVALGKKTERGGPGLASVQDERRVPLIPVQSSPVPHLPKAHLEQQQFNFFAAYERHACSTLSFV